MSKIGFIILIGIISLLNLAGIEKNEMKQDLSKSACLKFAAGGVFQVYLNGLSNDDPDIPNQYENNIESPAVGTFFGDSGNFRISLEYRLGTKTGRAFGFGVDYEYIELENDESGSELVLGKTMKINSIIPYIKLNKFLQNSLIYGKIGFPYRIYEGKSNFEGYKIVNRYSGSLGFRIGAGFDSNFSKNICFSGGIDLGFGVVEREDVEFYFENELMSKLTAEGDDLQDTQISIYLMITYNIFIDSAGDK